MCAILDDVTSSGPTMRRAATRAKGLGSIRRVPFTALGIMCIARRRQFYTSRGFIIG